jgi:hypothetical protein
MRIPGRFFLADWSMRVVSRAPPDQVQPLVSWRSWAWQPRGQKRREDGGWSLTESWPAHRGVHGKGVRLAMAWWPRGQSRRKRMAGGLRRNRGRRLRAPNPSPLFLCSNRVGYWSWTTTLSVLFWQAGQHMTDEPSRESAPVFFDVPWFFWRTKQFFDLPRFRNHHVLKPYY